MRFTISNKSLYFLRWKTIAFQLLVLACVWSISGLSSHAGKYNSVLEIGSTAPTWESLPATDGKVYSSNDFEQASVTVIVFTCNTCPYAIDYEGRLLALSEKYAEDARVQIIAINSNAIADDNMEAMKQKAQERGFSFTYLKDEQSELAAAFGAVRTPEWFVLDADRKVVYMGAFDDSADADQVTANYVETALECVLEKRAIETTETAPVGCLIRRPRRR